MAAYGTTVTLDEPKAWLVKKGVLLLTGKVTISNYNSTLAEITDITGKFKALYQVILTGVSSGGNVCRWDSTGKAIKAFVMSTDTEVANDVITIGTIEFIAIGRM